MGKKGSGKPRTTKQLVASLRRNATRPELMLHGALQFALANYDSGYVFQHPIGPYVADFFIGAVNLAIEADGSSHDTPWAVTHDMKRAKFIEGQGIEIIRFENKEIENDLVHVVDAILDKCWDLPRAKRHEEKKSTPQIVAGSDPIKVTICPPAWPDGSGYDRWPSWRKSHSNRKRGCTRR